MANPNDARKANADKRPHSFLKNQDFIAQRTLLCLRSADLEKRPGGSGWSWKLRVVYRLPDGKLFAQHTWLPAVNDQGVRDEYRGAIMRGIDYPSHSVRLETATPNSRYIELVGPYGEKCPCSNMSESDLAAELAPEEEEAPPF